MSMPTESKERGFRTICISMYLEPLEELDRMVRLLRSRGLTGISRSSLLRHALKQIDLDKVQSVEPR